tara:strand:- start:50 stop:178 length:129 start_codon:yes stop_codon:yes gene_type:complete
MENIQTLNEFLAGAPKTIELINAYLQYLKDNNALPSFTNLKK